METKTKQLNLRVTSSEKEKIEIAAKNAGYKSITKYIIDSSLNQKLFFNNKSIFYTLTLNPSLDYIISLGKNNPNNFKNKYQDTIWIEDDQYKLIAGGKGINASISINEFGLKTIPIFYASDLIGKFLKNNLNEFGIESYHLRTNLITKSKINLKLNNFNNVNQTEINIKPHSFGFDKKIKLINLAKLMNERDYFLMLGDFNLENIVDLKEIFEILNLNKVNIIIDYSRKEIKDFFIFKPFLIKASKRELQNALNKELLNIESIIKEMKKIQDQGVKNIIITLEDEGSILLSEDKKIYRAYVKNVNPISPQGAGDALIGAFLSNLSLSKNILESFKIANSAAISTIKTSGIGKYENYLKNIDLVEIKKIN